MFKHVLSAVIIAGLLLSAPAQAQVCGGGGHAGGGAIGGPGPRPFGPDEDDRTLVNGGAVERGSFTIANSASASSLTAEEKKALYDKLRVHLKGKNLPSKWLDDLEKENDTDFDFDHPEDADSFATYTDWNNTVHLKQSMDMDKLTNTDKSTLIHELFHAWYDQVPSFLELKLALPGEEAVAHAFEKLVDDGGIGAAVGEAIGTAEHKGGKAKEGVEALEKVDKIFIKKGYGSMFGNGFKNDKDAGKLKVVVKLTKGADAALKSLTNHIGSVTSPTGGASTGIAPVTGASKF